MPILTESNFEHGEDFQPERKQLFDAEPAGYGWKGLRKVGGATVLIVFLTPLAPCHSSRVVGMVVLLPAAAAGMERTITRWPELAIV